MRGYVLRRLLALLPTLVLASIIVFVTVRLIPGDVIDLMLSQNDVSADKKSRDDIIAALGFDKPMWEQYLRWVSAIVWHGDLGHSLWQGTPVTEHLLARLRDRADADVAPACDVDPQFGDVCGVDARQIGGVFQQELAAPERMRHPGAAELLDEHADAQLVGGNTFEHTV